MGLGQFIGETNPGLISYDTGTRVHLLINDVRMGRFSVSNHYRDGLLPMLRGVKVRGYELHVLSGDNDSEKTNLLRLFGEETVLKFRQSPQDKLE